MRRPPTTSRAPFVERVVAVRSPFRLDLTANVLRRLSTNAVDVYGDGVYRRALDGNVVFSAHEDAGGLRVRLTGLEAARYDPEALARRILGTDRDLGEWYRVTAAVPWLDALARGARGVKPPRYPSLWEAAVNAIVYQQVSIHAAGAILRRVIERYVPPIELDGVALRAFPSPEPIVEADPAELRGLGLSVNKIVALRVVGRAILDGDLNEAGLDTLPTADLTTALTAHKGIGPWTAAVIALRGFGRLDVFPMKDSGVARTLRDLSGDPGLEAPAVLAHLGDERGMLYYHLLLGRLAARGEVVLETVDSRGASRPAPRRVAARRAK